MTCLWVSLYCLHIKIEEASVLFCSPSGPPVCDITGGALEVGGRHLKIVAFNSVFVWDSSKDSGSQK